MVNEYTPLAGDSNYPFQARYPVLRQTRYIQCCLGAFFLAILIIVLVLLISIINIEVDRDIEKSIEEGQQALQLRDDVEKQMPVLQMTNPSFKHQMSTKTYTKADSIGRAGYANYHASKWIGKKLNHNLKHQMPQICSPILEETDWCIKKPKLDCIRSRYRTIDGTCNNLIDPYKSAAYTAFTRYLPTAYEDGVGEPRGGLKNSYLPPASIVSRLVHRPSYQNDPNFTLMLVAWGQFIDHDITATALSRGKNGEPITCCGQNHMHPECFPVIEKQKDGSLKCMEFVRSAPASSCCLEVRQQINQVTGYLDGSAIYGSDPQLASELRTFNGGTLKMLTSGATGKYLLPKSTDLQDGCNRKDKAEKGQYCFLTGDGRANENLFLTTMHLYWARQHNRLAKELAEVNPMWNDEKLYQEAKRIVAAQIQHITFYEFLPIILGREVINKHRIYLLQDGYFYGYNNTLPPSPVNSFAAAAFRFAHTLIPGMFKKLNKDNTTYEYFKLHQMLFDPFRLYNEYSDIIIQEMINNNIEKSDQYFSNDLKEHLFETNDENEPKTHGLDLVALNIQRGRDHGLATYTQSRKGCQLSVPKTFEELHGIMDSKSVDTLSKIYQKVEDIDLYTGALSEIPLKDSLIGPTFNCLIMRQFILLQYADRFWYETSEEPQAFTSKQLSEIRKTTLSSIICHNSDSMKYIPKWVMRAKLQNDIVLCEDISAPNLTFWKEN